MLSQVQTFQEVRTVLHYLDKSAVKNVGPSILIVINFTLIQNCETPHKNAGVDAG